MKKFGLIELSQDEENKTLSQVQEKINIISQELGEKEFLVGDSLTIGDIYISILGVITSSKLNIRSEISHWSENFYKTYIPHAFAQLDEKGIKSI